MSRARALLATAGSACEATLGGDRDDVEVEPPERGGDGDTEQRGGDDAGVEVDLGADAECDDGLAESDDDDRAVALGEVPGDELPAVGAEQIGPTGVEHDGKHPEDALRNSADEGGGEQQGDAERGGTGEPAYGVAQS